MKKRKKQTRLAWNKDCRKSWPPDATDELVFTIHKISFPQNNVASLQSYQMYDKFTFILE